MVVRMQSKKRKYCIYPFTDWSKNLVVDESVRVKRDIDWNRELVTAHNPVQKNNIRRALLWIQWLKRHKNG